MIPVPGPKLGSASRLLLITGAPASGKSQLAARLARRFGACCCSKDEIKELLFDTLGQGDARWSRRLSDASFALLFAQAQRLLCRQQLLLLEGNFRPGEHEAPLAALMASGPVSLAQVLCRADAATRSARLALRATDPQRHPGHRDQPLSAEQPDAGLLELPGPRWLYDSTSPGDARSDAQWDALCECIERWQAGASSGD